MKKQESSSMLVKKAKPTTVQYLAEFKYEDENTEDITEFPITIPASFEQLQVEEAKRILLRVLSNQRGKITHIFLWTFAKEKNADGTTRLEKKRLLMSSSVEPYKEFGEDAEAYVSPEDEDILNIIIVFFLRAVSKPYPPFVKLKHNPKAEKEQIPMTKKEMRGMVSSFKKKMLSIRLTREDKVNLYLALVEGLAQSNDFCYDDFFDVDILLNEALRIHKKDQKVKLLNRTLP